MDVWAELRSSRASPPHRAAGDPGRRGDYLAALQQFEQLYAAATQVGVPSRPILLYYGLSQGARAVLAAIKEGDWRVHGHGLRFAAPDRRKSIESTFVRPDERSGLAQALADAVGSEQIEAATTLAVPWAALPGLTYPAGVADQLHALRVTPDMFTPSGWTITAGTTTASSVYVSQPQNSILVDVPGASSFTEAAETLRNYPGAVGASASQGPISTTGSAGDPVSVRLSWELGEEGDTPPAGAPLRPFAFDGDGSPWLLPSIGGQRLDLIAVWWLVLFALSMLARYEPAAWVAALDIDRSELAVPLEAICGLAITEVPRLVARTLA